jgi:hypothetical protein
MEIKERNQTIVELYEMRVSYEEIGKRYNIKANSVCDIINKVKNKSFAPGMFNVHELDCWIMPTKKSDEYYN